MLKLHCCAAQQQGLNLLSDIHKTLYRSSLYKRLSIGLCFRVKSGDINILLYGTNKCQSLLSVFLHPSR